MVELSIIVPVYNEEAAILPVLDELTAFKHEFEHRYSGDDRKVELIFVDDGSTDHTASLLATSPHPKKVLSQRNQGYGAAIKNGFASAAGRWVGFLDADGTYPAKAFFPMYQEMNDSRLDLVIGCRLDETSGMPAIRGLGNRSFSKLLELTSKSSVKDIASGMRLIRRERIPDMRALPDGLDFTPAMTTWALHDAWGVKEVPISYRERIGESKLSVVKDGFRFTYDILSISALYNPLKLFGIAGVVLLISGLVLAAQPLLNYAQVRQVPESSIYRLLTALLFWVIGFQCVVCGVVGAVMARILHRKPMRASSLEHFLLTPGITGRLHWPAVVLVIIALWVNAAGLEEYLSVGTVSEHWSRLLAGVVLILTAIHLLFFEILVGYLRALDRYFSKP